jgi:hypothetical protein
MSKKYISDKFVVTGETDGSKFLKGDGTLDSSVYALNSHEHTKLVASGVGITTQLGTGTLAYTGQIGTGNTGLFSTINNANSIITVNKHSGDYYSQLGFSSNGRMYYRNYNAVAISSDPTKAWETVLTSGNINSVTGGYIPLSGSASSSGNKVFYSTDTSGDYDTAAIEIREVGLVTNTQSADEYAPSISFHWGAINAKKLFMDNSGVLNYTAGSNSGTKGGVHFGTGTFDGTVDIQNTLSTGNGTWLNIGLDSINPLRAKIYGESYNANFGLYNNGSVQTVKISSNGDSYFNGGNITTGGTIFVNNVASDKKIAFRRTGANNFSIEHDVNSLYFYNESTSTSCLKIDNNGNITATGILTVSDKILAKGQIIGSSAALQVNGFQRTGNIYLHSGGLTPDIANTEVIFSNVSGNLLINKDITASNLSGTNTGDQDLSEITRYQSVSNFIDGTLITTSIDASLTNGTSFVLDIVGKSYSSTTPPIKLLLQGYIYNNTFLSNSAIVNTFDFPNNITILEVGGKLCFWFARMSYWNSFAVTVTKATAGTTAPLNTVTSITDVVKPTATKIVEVTPIVQWSTSDFTTADVANWNAATPDQDLSGYLLNTTDTLAGTLNVTNDINIGTYGTTNAGKLYLNGTTANKRASLNCTNGNLHIDANDGNGTYLNYYSGSIINFGSGAGGTVASINSSGNFTTTGTITGSNLSGTNTGDQDLSSYLPISSVDIPGSADLDTYMSTGFYTQTSNSAAASGTNYPESAAGILEVYGTNTRFKTQRYKTYSGKNDWSRAYYDGTWGAWTNLAFEYLPLSGGTTTGTITMGTQKALVANNYGRGVYGVYSSTRYQHLWSMGTAYNLSDDGTSTGNLYGIAYTHNNVGGESKPGLSHQALFMNNGVTKTAIGTGIWTVGDITGLGDGTFSGTISASNLSGTNTGDQDLSTYWSQSSTGLAGVQRISTVTDFNADLPSGFYQNSDHSNAPGTNWYNMLNVRHSASSNQFGFQIAASYYDNHMYTRTYSGGSSGSTGTFRGWAKQYSDANFIAGTDYAAPVAGGYLPLSGGISTGLTKFDGGIEVTSGSSAGKLRIKRSTFSADGDDVVDIILNDSELSFNMDNDNDGDSSSFLFRYKSGGSYQNLLNFSSTSIAYKGYDVLHEGNFVAGTDYQPAGNYFTDGDSVLNMTNDDGFVYVDTTNKMYVRKDSVNYEIFDTSNLVDNKTYTNSVGVSGSYLGGHYSSGGTEKPNSSTFGAGKLKLAMLSSSNLGFGSTWNDVLWLSSYTGGDVKGSNALVFSKYNNDIFIASQDRDSASWGTGYKLFTEANFVAGTNYVAPSSLNSYLLNTTDTLNGSLTVSNEIYLGDGGNGYFYSDSNGRTAFNGGDFYIRPEVTNCFIYATNTYLGNNSGDTILFRGNTVTADNWGITASGNITGSNLSGTNTGDQDLSGYAETTNFVSFTPTVKFFNGTSVTHSGSFGKYEKIGDTVTVYIEITSITNGSALTPGLEVEIPLAIVSDFDALLLTEVTTLGLETLRHGKILSGNTITISGSTNGVSKVIISGSYLSQALV